MGSRRIRLALIVYSLLALVALVWGWARGAPDLYHHPAPWLGLRFPVSTVAALVSGFAVAAVVVAMTRVLVRRTRWASNLHVEFRNLLGRMSTAEIVVFALTSGVAEEMFFRGALQPAIGLVASAVVFGAVHVGPVKRFWAWTLWAGVMGLVFGVLYAATGELLAPVVAHAVINYENLHFINAYEPPMSGERDRARAPAVDSRLADEPRADRR